jgi:copper chaperone CopZ
MMKLFALFLLTLGMLTNAEDVQIKYALIGIDGMTCSSCSYATERSLLTLDFVKDVNIELNSNVAKVTFVEGKIIDLDKLAKKVRDASFSVGNFILLLTVKDQAVTPGACVRFGTMAFYFLQAKEPTMKGDVFLQLIGKDFMSRKNFKTWATYKKHTCTDLEGTQKQYDVIF